MNFLYLIPNGDYSGKGLIGVKKKIQSQTEAMKRLGFNCYLIYREGGRFILANIDNNKTDICQYFGEEQYNNFILDFCGHNKPELIYIRHFLSNFFVDDLYNKLSKQNISAKMILEFPTYPYDKEIKENYLLELDMFYRSRLSEYFKYSSNYNNLDIIERIPSCSLINGVDFNRIPIKRPALPDGEINLIAVSTFAFWHGFDRLIEGIKLYYQNNAVSKRINIHFAGIGPEYKRLRELTSRYGLEDYIQFHGMVYNEELDALFDKCQIAIGALGVHRRSSNNYASPIKTAEYCARGIPFVLSHHNVYYDNVCYALKISGDDKPVDMNQIIAFCDKIYSNKNINKIIRTDAEKVVSWDAQMKKILDFVGM